MRVNELYPLFGLIASLVLVAYIAMVPVLVIGPLPDIVLLIGFSAAMLANVAQFFWRRWFLWPHESGISRLKGHIMWTLASLLALVNLWVGGWLCSMFGRHIVIVMSCFGQKWKNAGYSHGTSNRMLSDGEVTEYAWDYRNRLTTVTVKNASMVITMEAAYLYDVNNLRIGKEVDLDGAGSNPAETERFILDNGHIILIFDGNSDLTHRYLYGPNIDQIIAEDRVNGMSVDVVWAFADHLGTIRDLTNSAGGVLNHISYDSFGQITAETNATMNFRYAFTGREIDWEIGQQYHRGRYYDTFTATWTGEDPIRWRASDMNLYRYTGNAPLLTLDLDGKTWKAIHIIDYGPEFGSRQIYIEGIFPGEPWGGAGLGDGGVIKEFARIVFFQWKGKSFWVASSGEWGQPAEGASGGFEVFDNGASSWVRREAKQWAASGYCNTAFSWSE